MWSRILELLLAGWLVASHDWVPAALTALFALLSFRFRKMHLCTLGVGLYLVYTAFAQPPGPRAENHLVVGLLLLILALIPSHAQQPPREWVEFLKQKKPKP